MAVYGYKASNTDDWVRIDHAQIPRGSYSTFANRNSNCNRGYPAYNKQVCFAIPRFLILLGSILIGSTHGSVPS